MEQKDGGHGLTPKKGSMEEEGKGEKRKKEKKCYFSMKWAGLVNWGGDWCVPDCRAGKANRDK